MVRALLINADDSVAVVIKNVEKGDIIGYGEASDQLVTAVEDIPIYHKVAIRNIAKGEQVLKYGYPIGEATTDIKLGAHVHCHNMVSPDGKEAI